MLVVYQGEWKERTRSLLSLGLELSSVKETDKMINKARIKNKGIKREKTCQPIDCVEATSEAPAHTNMHMCATTKFIGALCIFSFP